MRDPVGSNFDCRGAQCILSCTVRLRFNRFELDDQVRFCAQLCRRQVKPMLRACRSRDAVLDAIEHIHIDEINAVAALIFALPKKCQIKRSFHLHV